jgi:hypothetical protein
VIDANNINEILLENCYEAIRDDADFDSCPFIENADQADADSDGYGDVCDISPTDPDVPDN